MMKITQRLSVIRTSGRKYRRCLKRVLRGFNKHKSIYLDLSLTLEENGRTNPPVTVYKIFILRVTRDRI